MTNLSTMSALEKYRSIELDRTFKRSIVGIPVTLVLNRILLISLSSIGRSFPIISSPEEFLEILVSDLEEIKTEPENLVSKPPQVVDSKTPETVKHVPVESIPKLEPIVPESVPKNLTKPETIVPQNTSPKPILMQSENLSRPETVVVNSPPKLEPIGFKTLPYSPQTEPDLPEKSDIKPAVSSSSSVDLPVQETTSSPVATKVDEYGETPTDKELDSTSVSNSEIEENRSTDRVGSLPPSSDTVTETQVTKLPEPLPPIDKEKENKNKVQFACLKCDKPSFPIGAKEKGLQGEVKISLDVASDGSVTGVRLTSSSGHPELDQAAMEQAKRWRFTPSADGKQGLPARIDFQIEGTEYQRQAQERKRIKEQPPASQELPQPIAPIGDSS